MQKWWEMKRGKKEEIWALKGREKKMEKGKKTIEDRIG